MVIPLHGVAGSTRRDPDTTAKSYNYCVATANRHGHAVVSNDIAFSRSAVTHRRSSAVMTATMNPRFVRPAPSALGPAHTPRIAGREPGVAHTSDTKTPCRAQNTIPEPHTTASRNRPPLRRTHCDGAGGPSQGATSHVSPRSTTSTNHDGYNYVLTQKDGHEADNALLSGMCFPGLHDV